jgi:hypothetical protein
MKPSSGEALVEKGEVKLLKCAALNSFKNANTSKKNP